VEIDIHSMADAEYLVCHANRLEEATTSSGPVGLLTRAAAQELRDKRDVERRLPLLSEVVALAQDFAPELQLDLKDWRPLSPERVETLARLVEPLADRVMVSSGRDWNLRAIASRVPGLRLGFDPNHYLDAGTSDAPLPARLGAYGYRDDHPLAAGRTQPVEEYLRDRIEILLAQCPSAIELFIDYRLVLQAAADGVSLPELVHARGVAVTAWTLDYDGEASLATLAGLATAGVDRVTTNTAQQFITSLSSSQT
jgi:glycerophosphoryl diester phosphodiesterase